MTDAFFIMGGFGLVIGVGLAIASKIFYVYVDPVILSIEDVLPGANCGGCGLPGCSSNAEAIVAGTAAPNSCVAAGDDVTEAIAGILGVTVEAKEPDIAKPGCTYSTADAEIKYIYDGLNDCKAAALFSGGMKVCSIGCLGLGSCVKACQFGALSMGQDGLPVVDETLCTGCGACEKACPKNIINLSSVTRRIMQEYTTEMCTTPCQRSCPAGINISEYINQVALGNYHQAVQVIKERNPFPTVIGRICPRPCENDCRRKYVDEPVAINFLKRFAADFERRENKRILPYKAPSTNRKIAIIGGGVEGLSTAFFAARLGHDPTVFEAGSHLGGLLRSAIARYRLSDKILNWDIDGILEMGVTAETQKVMGKDISLQSLLKDDYEAVFTASGGWDSRLLQKKVAGPIPGLYLLIDLLKGAETNKFQWKSDIVIAGGGKLAFKAAALCKKNGAKKITIIFRETRDQIKVEKSDLENIKKEGVKLIFNSGITEITGEKDQLSTLEYTCLDGSAKKTIKAKTLILSSGRFPELIFTRINTDEDNNNNNNTGRPLQWRGVEPCKPSALNESKGLFASGDVKTDYSAAIKAINGGRRAAASIHMVINGLPLSVPDTVLTSDSMVQNIETLKNVEIMPRKIMPLAPSEDMETCDELEKGFDEKTALAEAKRCLKCGLVCYKSSIN